MIWCPKQDPVLSREPRRDCGNKSDLTAVGAGSQDTLVGNSSPELCLFPRNSRERPGLCLLWKPGACSFIPLRLKRMSAIIGNASEVRQSMDSVSLSQHDPHYLNHLVLFGAACAVSLGSSSVNIRVDPFFS